MLRQFQVAPVLGLAGLAGAAAGARLDFVEARRVVVLVPDFFEGHCVPLVIEVVHSRCHLLVAQLPLRVGGVGPVHPLGVGGLGAVGAVARGTGLGGLLDGGGGKVFGVNRKEHLSRYYIINT